MPLCNIAQTFLIICPICNSSQNMHPRHNIKTKITQYAIVLDRPFLKVAKSHPLRTCNKKRKKKSNNIIICRPHQ